MLILDEMGKLPELISKQLFKSLPKSRWDSSKQIQSQSAAGRQAGKHID